VNPGESGKDSQGLTESPESEMETMIPSQGQPADSLVPVQSKNTPSKKSAPIYPDENFGPGYERKSFGDKLLIQELRQLSGGQHRLIDKIDCPFFMFQPDMQKVRQKKPWLPEMRKDRKYTLVLDLDETRIHFEEAENEASHFLLRPHAQNFIREMAKHYEVVIFTAAQKSMLISSWTEWIPKAQSVTACTVTTAHIAIMSTKKTWPS